MKSRKILLMAMAFACVGFVLSGCSTTLLPEPFDANLRLTAGQAKMTVKTGVTTQSEIFEALGVPNVVALQSGSGEVWTYDQIKVRRTAQGYGVGAFFATLFPFSEFSPNLGNGVGATGIGAGGNVGTVTTFVSTATLIVRFDTAEKVISYHMLVTSF